MIRIASALALESAGSLDQWRRFGEEFRAADGASRQILTTTQRPHLSIQSKDLTTRYKFI
jgi:hypothetical protein